MSTYETTIRPHLTAAQEYAYRAAREITRMPARPAFYTMAEDELGRAEHEAERLLETIRSARQELAGKSVAGPEPFFAPEDMRRTA